jgi:hypothetical protein
MKPGPGHANPGGRTTEKPTESGFPNEDGDQVSHLPNSDLVSHSRPSSPPEGRENPRNADRVRQFQQRRRPSQPSPEQRPSQLFMAIREDPTSRMHVGATNLGTVAAVMTMKRG